MITMCNLLAHLEQKRSLAKVRQEQTEVDRLDGLIRFHREKCLTCSGMKHTTLEENLFGRKVIVTREAQS